jgi:tetratricopeptide (TPR) repeat protein
VSGAAPLEALVEEMMQAHVADRPAESLLRARRVLEEDPGMGLAWMVLGASLSELARYEEALEALGKALENLDAEGRRLALRQMGHLYRTMGDLRKAEEWYRRAVEADPEHTAPRLYLGGVLAAQGRLEEAEREHRRATGCDQGDEEEVWVNLGLVLRAQERFDEAVVCLRRALELDATYEAAREALSDVEAAIVLRDDGRG